MRGALHGVYGNMASAGGKAVLYALVALFGVSLVTTAEDAETRERRLFALALALPLYAAVNLVLHQAGMQNPNPAGATAGTSSQLAGLVGISSSREVFPLTTSINLYSIVVGASIAAVGVLRLRAPQWCPRWLVALVSLICLYELLVGDSRTEVVVALGVVLLFAVFRNFKGSRWIPVVIPALPLIRPRSAAARVDLRHSQRPQPQYARAKPVRQCRQRHRPCRHLAGRVEGAQASPTSGAVRLGCRRTRHLRRLPEYAYVFPRDPLGYTEFTHSLPIQIVLDEGVIGLLLLIAALWMTFSALRRHIALNPSSPAIALVAILIVFVACGATEVSITYYAEEALVATLLIMGAAAGLAVRPQHRH